MSSEIVWVDGDTKNLIVIYRSNAPPDAAHYYYFPGEISFPNLVKWADIEPVRKHTLQVDNEKFDIYLSRIHYWGLVLWINPTLVTLQNQQRPVCIFENNVHTPYLPTNGSGPVLQQDIEGANPLGWADRLAWFLAIKYFTSRLPGVKAGAPTPYPGIVVEVKQQAINDPAQRFDIPSIVAATRHLVLVGINSDMIKVRSHLADALGKATAASLQEFLTKSSIATSPSVGVSAPTPGISAPPANSRCFAPHQFRSRV